LVKCHEHGVEWCPTCLKVARWSDEKIASMVEIKKNPDIDANVTLTNIDVMEAINVFRGPDKLEELFSMQSKFDERVYEKPIKDSLLIRFFPALITNMVLQHDGDVTFKDLSREIRVTLLLSALIGEAKETQEALGLLPEFGAKWWKENINWDLVNEELMDCLHFILSIFLNIGLTPDDIMKHYEKKWKINFQRQDSNY
jgi:hypothetical protein